MKARKRKATCIDKLKNAVPHPNVLRAVSITLQHYKESNIRDRTSKYAEHNSYIVVRVARQQQWASKISKRASNKIMASMIFQFQEVIHWKQHQASVIHVMSETVMKSSYLRTCGVPVL